MKKFLALFAFGLFVSTLYFAFVQGGVSMEAMSGPIALLSGAMRALLVLANKNLLESLLLLALMVEVILFYPQFRLQLEQRKIHRFHRKLVDRFNRGELSVSKSRQEVHKLYEVNAHLHQKVALLVLSQVALFLLTFWAVEVEMPQILGSEGVLLNEGLLSRPTNVWMPLLVSLAYLFHALLKIRFKEKQDRVSPAQIFLAVLLAMAGAIAVYVFSGLFSTALSLYFATLVLLATLRYAAVERYAYAWGLKAQAELISLLRQAESAPHRFRSWLGHWRQKPFFRHLNLALLEESLSMSLGLMLALSFAGKLQ